MKTALTAAMMFAFLSVGYGVHRLRDHIGGDRFFELSMWLAVGLIVAGLLHALWNLFSAIAETILRRGERK